MALKAFIFNLFFVFLFSYISVFVRLCCVTYLSFQRVLTVTSDWPFRSQKLHIW